MVSKAMYNYRNPMNSLIYVMVDIKSNHTVSATYLHRDTFLVQKNFWTGISCKQSFFNSFYIMLTS